MDLVGYIRRVERMGRAGYLRRGARHPMIDLTGISPACWSSTMAWRRHGARCAQLDDDKARRAVDIVDLVLDYRATVPAADRVWWPDPSPVLVRWLPDTAGSEYRLEAEGGTVAAIPVDHGRYVREAALRTAEALACPVTVTFRGITIYRRNPPWWGWSHIIREFSACDPSPRSFA